MLQKTFEADDVPMKEELLEEFDSVTSTLIEDQFGSKSKPPALVSPTSLRESADSSQTTSFKASSM